MIPVDRDEAGRPSRPDPRRLLQEHGGLLQRVTTSLLGRYRLAPGETRALRRLVRARLLADDYRLLREFSGRSSFATYLTVVVVRLVRELADGWRVPRPVAGEGDGEAEGTPPRPGVRVALALLRKLPPRDRVLLRLRFGEQLPLSSIGGALASTQPELRRRLGELRRVLLRELTEIGCEDRHSAALFAAATRLDLRREGEPGPSRPSIEDGEIESDDSIPS